MFCGCGNKVNVLDVNNGKVTDTLGQVCYNASSTNLKVDIKNNHIKQQKILEQWYRKKPKTKTTYKNMKIPVYTCRHSRIQQKKLEHWLGALLGLFHYNKSLVLFKGSAVDKEYIGFLTFIIK